MKKRFSYRLGGYLFALPYLTLFAIFVLAPLIFGLTLSLLQWEMLSPLPPKLIGFGNYSEALNDPYFWKALKVTALFVVMSMPLTVVIALAIAMGLDGLRRRRAIYRAAFLLPMMVNISVAGILWRWFLNTEFGVFNAYLAKFGLKIPWLTEVRWAMPSIVLMSLWWGVGGPAVILLAGLQQIPDHYYEAAAVDGATPWNRFWHITLPLLRPVLLFVIVMNIIGAFQVFGQTFIITGGGPTLSTRVMMHYVYQTAFNNYRMGYAASMSWLLFLIIAVFAVFQFKRMRE